MWNVDVRVLILVVVVPSFCLWAFVWLLSFGEEVSMVKMVSLEGRGQV